MAGKLQLNLMQQIERFAEFSKPRGKRVQLRETGWHLTFEKVSSMDLWTVFPLSLIIGYCQVNINGDIIDFYSSIKIYTEKKSIILRERKRPTHSLSSLEIYSRVWLFNGIVSMLNPQTRENIRVDWRWTLFCVQSVMMAFSANSFLRVGDTCPG